MLLGFWCQDGGFAIGDGAMVRLEGGGIVLGLMCVKMVCGTLRRLDWCL